MKSVRRLSDEPTLLSEYRAENPAEDVASVDEANRTWERFRNKAPDAYAELRAQLVANQFALCGYCEQRLTNSNGILYPYDQQVEHVAAKSGGTGRTLDFQNFMLCCGGGTYREKDSKYFIPSRHYSTDENVSCGQAKRDFELPHSCDPRDFPMIPRLVNVDLEGTIQARDDECQSHGIDPMELNRMMNEVLNLNCERLKRARREVLRVITDEIIFLAKELLQLLTLDTAKRNELEQSFVEGRLAQDTHGHLRSFWTTERQYLEPWSSTWVHNNARLLRGEKQ